MATNINTLFYNAHDLYTSVIASGPSTVYPEEALDIPKTEPAYLLN